ncbi:MAG: Na+/H+ antiporter subunit E [Opitutales bacterium]
MNRITGFIAFLVFYIRDIVSSNFRVAYDVLTPTFYMKPGIIAMDVAELNNRQTMLLANFITMTPGTLGLSVSKDRKKLFIHAMYIDQSPEKMAADLSATYGRRVRRVF